MRNDSAFESVRNHGQELGACAKDSSLLRRALRSFLKDASDNRVSSRMNKLMLDIRKFDASKIGERRVHRGILHKEARALLLGFEFNKDALLKEILRKTAFVDVTKGILTIESLSPKKDIVFPKAATHVQLQGGLLWMDFEKKTFKLEKSTEVLLSKKRY